MAKNSNKPTEQKADIKPIVDDEEVKTEEISNVETNAHENEKDERNSEAPKMPEFKKLICKQSFTDKFDKATVYKIGDELNITDLSRRNDLIERGLAVEE